MSGQRARGNSNASLPHSVSLKVLRLSRPTLATQTPLPKTGFDNGLDIDPRASLACPSGDVYSSFPLSSVLTLPGSFGLAYVGEGFSCTLCANNELDGDSNKSVSAVKISADLQTPSIQTGIALKLISSTAAADNGYELESGRSLQINLQHDLKEAGPHVLAVTLTYTETTHEAQGDASGGKTRTFRKLYQFVAQQQLTVRSKITERKTASKDHPRLWMVEAQLENVGETSIVLESVKLKEQEGMQSVDRAVESRDGITLKPQDIQQIMFLVRQLNTGSAGRKQLGQIAVDWRGPMGEPGKMTTGWLTSKT